MNLKPLYLGCKLLLLVCVLFAILATSLLVWLGMGARDISRINPYLEAALSVPSLDMAVTIGNSELKWQSVLRPAVITLHHVEMRHGQETFFTLPDTDVTLNVWHMLVGSVVPERVTLRALDIQLAHKADGRWVWMGDGGQELGLDSLIGDTKNGGGGGEAPINGLHLQDSSLSIHDEARDMTLKAEGIKVIWAKHGAHLHQLETSAVLTLTGGEILSPSLRGGQRPTRQSTSPSAPVEEWIAASATPPRNDEQLKGSRIGLKAKINDERKQGTFITTVEHFNPAVLCGAIIDCKGLPVLDMPISGTIGAQLKPGYSPDEMIFSLNGEKGSFAFPPHFPETLMIDTLAVSGKMHKNMTQLDIEQVGLALGKTKINASASFALGDGGYFIDMNARGVDMPVNDMYKYWPEGLADETRTWAITNIREGVATEASAVVHLTPADFKAEVLPDGFLSTYITIKDSTVDYLKDFPKVKASNAKVHFTGTTMTAEAIDATVLSNTRLPKATIVLPDLNKDGTPMVVDLEVDSNAKDVLTLLQPPRFDFLKNSPVDASGATGSAKGKIHLSFDAFTGQPTGTIDWSKVIYGIEASYDKLSGISYRNVSVDNGKGTLSADNKALRFSLDGALDNEPVMLSYDSKEGNAAKYEMKGTLSKDTLITLGLPESIPLTGSVGVDAVLASVDGKMGVNAKIDLAKTGFAIAPIGYEKAAGVPATISLESDADDNNRWTFDYKAENLNSKGIIGVDGKAQALTSLHLDSFNYGRNDLSLDYTQSGDNKTVALKGKALDLAPWMSQETPGNRSISNMPSLKLDLALNTVYLKGDHRLNNVNGSLDCLNKRCNSADMTATVGEKGSMLLNIAPENGKRHFHLQTDQASDLLQATDIVEQINGGTLEIKGDYDDSKPGNPLVGRMVMKDFVLKDAPILGRILNLSSLTGMYDTLRGQGMAFDRMVAHFTFVDDKITVTDGRTHGSSLGVVTEGVIDIGNGALDLKGSLAPAYVLNSIVGKIPLIGEALVGGKGEGVFAVNYSVGGTFDEPKISANPLSVLTPGFTRKFFDIFEKSDKKENVAEPKKDEVKE